MTVQRARIKYGFAMVVITVMALLTFVYPVRTRSAAARAELADLNAILGEADVAITQIEDEQNRLQSLTERRSEETKPIPDHADLPGLIKAITQDISMLPLVGSNVNRSRDTKVDKDRSLGLVIETSGSFQGVFDLIRRIEDLPRLVRINELTIRIEKENGSSDDVTASVDISAFYRPAATESP